MSFNTPADRENAYDLLADQIDDIYQKDYTREELISKVRFNRETMVMNRHSTNQHYKWKEQAKYKMRLKIEVIGVEKRFYENQWKIVYCVKIQLLKPEQKYQIAFYEIEELREIEQYLSLIYPNLKLPIIDTRYKNMNSEDVRVDFTKYFEYREIILEDFLNSVLRCSELASRPELVAYKLRINEALWDYLNKISSEFNPSECGCEACLHNEVFTGIDFYEKQKAVIRKQKYQFCILKSFYTQNCVAEMVEPKMFKKFDV